MADKQISALPSAGPLNGFEIVHIVQDGNSRMISLSELATILGGEPGADGKSAYEVAVDEGFEGTVEEWLLSLIGAEGPQGPAGNDGTNGTNGGPGPQGEPGPSIVPNQYGTFDEAIITAIETADVDWNLLIIANGDERSNQSIPASLTGDMSGHLVRYEEGGTWLDLGPIVGVAGPQGPGGNDGQDGAPGADGSDGQDGEPGAQGSPGPIHFNTLVAHPDGIASGGYPITYYVPRAATITKVAYVAEASTTFQIEVNASSVTSGTATSSKIVDDVEIVLAAGDEIVLNILSGGALFFDVTLVEA